MIIFLFISRICSTDRLTINLKILVMMDYLLLTDTFKTSRICILITWLFFL